MIARGFGPRWMQWMDMIFSSGHSSLLLNGIPGKHFLCKRGVRQGDPLSPLIFVLAADISQSIFNDAMTHKLIDSPLNTSNDFPMVQYADGTILLLSACPLQIQETGNLLMHFSACTRLRVNYSKSVLVPINVNPQRTQLLANILGCDVGSFPFTYLGLPLGTSKPKVEHFIPMMQRIERRLTGCSTLLSYGEILTLIKSAFSSMPTFLMSSLAIPTSVINQVNKYIRRCFWRKYGMEE